MRSESTLMCSKPFGAAAFWLQLRERHTHLMNISLKVKHASVLHMQDVLQEGNGRVKAEIRLYGKGTFYRLQ